MDFFNVELIPHPALPSQKGGGSDMDETLSKDRHIMAITQSSSKTEIGVLPGANG